MKWYGSFIFLLIAAVYSSAQDIPCPEPDEFVQVEEFEAQLPPENAPQATQDREHFERMEKMHGQRIEQFRTRKLLEMLDLDRDQQKRFMDLHREQRQQQRRLDRAKREAVDYLAKLAKVRRPDERAIQTQIDRIASIEKERREEQDRFFQSVRTLLRPAQMARFVIFHERFEFQMLERLREFRGRGMGRMHMMPPGGPPDDMHEPDN